MKSLPKVDYREKLKILSKCNSFRVKNCYSMTLERRDLFLNNHKSSILGFIDNDMTSIDVLIDEFVRKRPQGMILSNSNVNKFRYFANYNYLYYHPVEIYSNKKPENLLAKKQYKEFFNIILDQNPYFFKAPDDEYLFEIDRYNKLKIPDITLTSAYNAVNDKVSDVRLFHGRADDLIMLEDLCHRFSLQELRNIYTNTIDNYNTYFTFINNKYINIDKRDFEYNILEISRHVNMDSLFDNQVRYNSAVFNKINYFYAGNFMPIENAFVDLTFKYVNDSMLESCESMFDFSNHYKRINYERLRKYYLSNSSITGNKDRSNKTYKVRNNNDDMEKIKLLLNTYSNSNTSSNDNSLSIANLNSNEIKDNTIYTNTYFKKTNHLNKEFLDLNHISPLTTAKISNTFKLNEYEKSEIEELKEIMEKLKILTFIFSKEFDNYMMYETNPFKNKEFFQGRFSNISDSVVFNIYKNISDDYDNEYEELYYNEVNKLYFKEKKFKTRLAFIPYDEELNKLENTEYKYISNYKNRIKYLNYANKILIMKALLNLVQRKEKDININYELEQFKNFINGSVNDQNKRIFRSLIAEANAELGLVELPIEIFGDYQKYMEQVYNDKVVNTLYNDKELSKKLFESKNSILNQVNEIEHQQIKSGYESPIDVRKVINNELLLEEGCSEDYINKLNEFYNNSRIKDEYKNIMDGIDLQNGEVRNSSLDEWKVYDKETQSLSEIPNANKNQFKKKAQSIFKDPESINKLIDSPMKMIKSKIENEIVDLIKKINNTSDIKIKEYDYKKDKKAIDFQLSNIQSLLDNSQLKDSSKNEILSLLRKELTDESNKNLSVLETKLKKYIEVLEGYEKENEFSVYVYGEDKYESQAGNQIIVLNDITKDKEMLTNISAEEAVKQGSIHNNKNFLELIKNNSIEELKKLGVEHTETPIILNKYGAYTIKAGENLVDLKKNSSFTTELEHLQNLAIKEKYKNRRNVKSEERELTEQEKEDVYKKYVVERYNYYASTTQVTSNIETPDLKSLRKKIAYFNIEMTKEIDDRVNNIESALATGRAIDDPLYYEELASNKNYIIKREEYLKRYFRDSEEDNYTEKASETLVGEIEEGLKLTNDEDYYYIQQYKHGSDKYRACQDMLLKYIHSEDVKEALDVREKMFNNYGETTLKYSKNNVDYSLFEELDKKDKLFSNSLKKKKNEQEGNIMDNDDFDNGDIIDDLNKMEELLKENKEIPETEKNDFYNDLKKMSLNLRDDDDNIHIFKDNNFDIGNEYNNIELKEEEIDNNKFTYNPGSRKKKKSKKYTLVNNH